MGLSNIAALIAAIAFAALVVYIILLLIQLTKILKKAEYTVSEINSTLKTVSKDADRILDESNELLSRTNVLVDDVTWKMEKLNPLFQTFENLGNKADRATADKNKSSIMSMNNAFKAAKLAKTLKSFISGRK